MRTVRQIALGELGSVSRTSRHPREYGDEGVSLYSIPAFDNGSIPESVSAKSIKSDKWVLDGASILISKLNPSIPRVWLVDEAPDPLSLASKEFVIFRPNERIYRRYLWAALRSRAVQACMASFVSGTSTSRQRVHLEDLLTLSIPVPDMDEQIQIGDLIYDVCRRSSLARINELEARNLAQSLYARLRPHEADRAPLSDLADVTSGVSYKSSDLREGPRALLTLKCFRRDGAFNAGGLKAWQGEARENQYVDEGDLLLAITDLTRDAPLLGRPMLARYTDSYQQIAASCDVARIAPKQIPVSWLYMSLLADDFREHCRRNSSGTTVVHLPRPAVLDFEVPVASDEVMAEFDGVGSLLMRKEILASKIAQQADALEESLLENYF